MAYVALIAQLVNNLVDKDAFKRIVHKYDADKVCKKYTAWCQFVWMLLCHLGDCNSIQDISNILMSTTGNIKHLAMSEAPSKSSVVYQNEHRDWRVFRDYSFVLLKSLGQHLNGARDIPQVNRKIKLLDSTTVTLSLGAFPWARYTHEKGAIKMHTILSFEQDAPHFMHATDGKVPDNVAAMLLPVKEDMVIVADRGYMDFELLKNWDSKKVQFVVRHTKNIVCEPLEEWELPKEAPQNILKDEIVQMTGPESSVYKDNLRRVVVYNEKHKYAVELLTNNFTWEA